MTFRDAAPFLALVGWLGCHVVSGLDGLTVGDEGATTGSTPQGAGGMSVATANGVGAIGGGPCENDCCCLHPMPECTGTPLHAAQDIPNGVGGAGGVIMIPPTSASQGGGYTMVASGPGGGMSSTSSGMPSLCITCVCGNNPECCNEGWGVACVFAAKNACAAECGCEGL